jgi:hypothetical protein
VTALGKNPEQYRKDAATLKEATKAIGFVDADTKAHHTNKNTSTVLSMIVLLQLQIACLTNKHHLPCLP